MLSLATIECSVFVNKPVNRSGYIALSSADLDQLTDVQFSKPKDQAPRILGGGSGLLARGRRFLEIVPL